MKKNKKKRKPQYFRFTVDKLDGKWTTHALTVASESHRESGEGDEIIVRPGLDFVDEVVVGGVLHLEAMSRRSYWINVAGVTLWVTLRKNGTVKQVHVYGPGEYDEPHEGVEYGFKP